MAYIPPHKRLSAAAPGTDHTTIASSPSAASPSPSPSPASPHQKITLKLDYSPFAVKRFLVISESSTSQLLEFIPFEGERVFSHLEGSSLFVIKRDDQRSAVHEAANSAEDRLRLVDCKPNEITEVCANSDLVINEEDKESAICHTIVEALRDDLASVIQELKRSMLLDDGMNLKHPKILLSVGRMLFSSIGQSFDWKRRCTPECLEQEFETRGRRKTILKTFFDDQPSNLFTFFKETAEKDNLQIRTKERYFIQVEDNAKPHTGFYCVCYLAGDSTTTFQEKPIKLQCLEMRKAKRLTRLRHMVADVACIDKSHDLRIHLYTDEKCITAEERSDLESLLGHVLFVDGKPFLRYGDACSSSGRFQFEHIFLSKTYSFKGATFKWRLESVMGRRYVRIKPILAQDYLQGHVDCTMDELMRSIEETLLRLWQCCSGSQAS